MKRKKSPYGPQAIAKANKRLIKKANLEQLAERMLSEKNVTLNPKSSITKEQEMKMKELIKQGRTPKQAWKEIGGRQEQMFRELKFPEYVVTDKTAMTIWTPKISAQKASYVNAELKKIKAEAEKMKYSKEETNHSRNFELGRLLSFVWEERSKPGSAKNELNKKVKEVQKKYNLSKSTMRDLVIDLDMENQIQKLQGIEDATGLAIGHDKKRIYMDSKYPGISTLLHETGHFFHQQRGDYKLNSVQKELFANAFDSFSRIKLNMGEIKDHKKMYELFEKTAKQRRDKTEQKTFFIMRKILDKYPSKRELLQKGPLIIREIANKKMTYEQMLKEIEKS